MAFLITLSTFLHAICILCRHRCPAPKSKYSSRAKVSGRAANDPGFVKVSQNSILRISINIHRTAGELYS